MSLWWAALVHASLALVVEGREDVDQAWAQQIVRHVEAAALRRAGGLVRSATTASDGVLTLRFTPGVDRVSVSLELLGPDRARTAVEIVERPEDATWPRRVQAAVQQLVPDSPRDPRIEGSRPAPWPSAALIVGGGALATAGLILGVWGQATANDLDDRLVASPAEIGALEDRVRVAEISALSLVVAGCLSIAGGVLWGELSR